MNGPFKIKNATQQTFWVSHNNGAIKQFFYIIYSIVTKILVLTTQALVQNLVQIQILVKLYISDRPSGGNKTHMGLCATAGCFRIVKTQH